MDFDIPGVIFEEPMDAEPLNFMEQLDVSLQLDLPGMTRAPDEEVRAPEAPLSEIGIVRLMPKRTWQPNRLRRKRKHGFLRRMKTAAGRKVLGRRRRKGRWRVSVT